MNKSVLITGGYGYLGRVVAAKFSQMGFRVVGIGRGEWLHEEFLSSGFTRWINSTVTLSKLLELEEEFSLVIHCAGGGSVGYSAENPSQDFVNTVHGTMELLEFLRHTGSMAKLIYPSSAGVYGHKKDSPIKEGDFLDPISPYGYHKRIAEELIECYSKVYGIKAIVIRFFSIYGPGLKKQLLWDAGQKILKSKDRSIIFWGTGNETRDWISGDDAAELIHVISELEAPSLFSIINGASGSRVTIKRILNMLNNSLDGRKEIVFNGKVRPGDPLYYHADVSRARALGWRPKVSLESGIEGYAKWLVSGSF